MSRDILFLGIFVLLFCGFLALAPSTTSPAKIVKIFISKHGISLIKWLWSLKTTTKTAVYAKSMVKFENGYSVETVLDGSKLGIEPYSLEVLPNGELLILDSQHNNIYKISSLSLYSRPRLVAGSPEGYPGHVDGRLRDARLNNPKGFTVDDRGNIYVADTVNNAIRKISEGGVTTIAGGKMVRGGGHVDGPSEDAKFSNDFDVIYVGSSCSLLVVDRGNQAIREIQLHFDNCSYQYGSSFPLGIAVLVAAGFFGYMLALLQRRLGSVLSYQTDHALFEAAPDQGPIEPVRPPLIPTGDEQEKQEESFLETLRIFISNAWVFSVELFRGMFPTLRKKQTVSFNFNHQETKHSAFSTTTWPIQKNFVIHNKDESTPVEIRNPTSSKIYPFMSKDATEKMQQLRQTRPLYRCLDAEFLQEQKQHKHQQHHRRHQSAIPHTLYEQNCEKTNEIVFGPGQEQDQRRAAAAASAKSTEFGEQMKAFTHQNIQYRAHQSVSYPYGYYSYT